MPRTATTSVYFSHPQPDLAKVVRLVHGRRKNDRSLYEAQFHVEGEWTSFRSLKTHDRAEAEVVAAATYRTFLDGKQSAHPSRTIAKIAEFVVADLKAEAAAIVVPGKKRRPLMRIEIIEKQIIPRVGAMQVTAVNDEDFLLRWQNSIRVRAKQKGTTKPPSRSYVGNLNAALQAINKKAHTLGYLCAGDIRRMRQNEAPVGGRRPSFTDTEMVKLASHLTHAWVVEGRSEIVAEQRWMLTMMVPLIATTGIRPGLELETLSHEQIDMTRRDKQTGLPVIVITVRTQQGKRKGARNVILDTKDPAWPQMHLRLAKYLREHLNRSGGDPKKFIFARPSDGKMMRSSVVFRRALDEFGLRTDPATGEDRTLYSVRHYFATKIGYRKETAIPALATRMGTSLMMLQKYYFHDQDPLSMTMGVSESQPKPEITDANIVTMAKKRLHAPEDKVREFVERVMCHVGGNFGDDGEAIQEAMIKTLCKQSVGYLEEVEMMLVPAEMSLIAPDNVAPLVRAIIKKILLDEAA